MTQIVFSLICLSAFLNAKIADKKNRKASLFVCVAILTLASGLRGEGVGIDTTLYIHDFINDFPYGWRFEEPGFRVMSRSILKLFNNTTIVFLVYAFIINMLICCRLWDFRKVASFPFMIFLYIMIYYIGTMNVMRQYLAVAIVFWATRFLESKKYIVFIIFQLIASLIHTTALLGVAYLIIYFWRNATLKQKKIILMPIVSIGLLIAITIAKYEIPHIENYFSKKINNINITYIYRMFVFCIALLIKRIPSSYSFMIIKTQSVSKCSFMDIYTLFYFMGIWASSMGMFFMFLSRLGLYYLMFELVFWGKAIRIGKNRDICFGLISIYALYVFAHELIFNGSGIFPYYLCFF